MVNTIAITKFLSDHIKAQKNFPLISQIKSIRRALLPLFEQIGENCPYDRYAKSAEDLKNKIKIVPQI